MVTYKVRRIRVVPKEDGSFMRKTLGFINYEKDYREIYSEKDAQVFNWEELNDFFEETIEEVLNWEDKSFELDFHSPILDKVFEQINAIKITDFEEGKEFETEIGTVKVSKGLNKICEKISGSGYQVDFIIELGEIRTFWGSSRVAKSRLIEELKKKFEYDSWYRKPDPKI